ncbi:MAG: TIGR01212 family radical SAM protein [Candidatus Omnitrophota bacterium]
MRYRKASEYFRERFGQRVARISVDAGFSCPNRDGSLSVDGCAFCDNRAFSHNSGAGPRPLREQIEEGMRAQAARFKARIFMLYFQAYTNTYAPVGVLRERYDAARMFDSIVSVAIGTRPDCVDDSVLDLIDEYAGDYEVWIEYGLQSVRDETLRAMNRHHTYADFLRAFEMTRRRTRIKTAAHVIIGLPGESADDIFNTASALGKLGVDGVKIHPMHAVKGTRLEQMWRSRAFDFYDKNAYADLCVGFIERLSPDTVVHRFTADCPGHLLAGPGWIKEKADIISLVERRLDDLDTFQGRLREETV